MLHIFTAYATIGLGFFYNTFARCVHIAIHKYNDCVETAFERVFSARPKKVEYLQYSRICETDCVLAALKFSGPFYGEVVLAVDEALKAPVTRFVLDTFGAPLDTPEDIVHTEILNIFSGNMLTELTRRNLLMNISPPKPVGELSMQDTRIEVVIITAENDLEFKFYLIMRNEPND